MQRLRRWYRELIVYPWQRVRRGYSDQDLWNFDAYLAGVLAQALPQLADTGAGFIPLDAKYEPDPDADATYWKALLYDMAEGFQLAATSWEWDYEAGHEEKQARVERSYELLATWHGALWD